MKEEKVSAFDAILDEDNTENIVLYNEDEQPVEFEQIAIIPIDENDYCILRPVVPFEGMKEDEALVFEFVTDENGEDKLEVVKDEEVIDKVFDMYNDLYDSQNQ